MSEGSSEPSVVFQPPVVSSDDEDWVKNAFPDRAMEFRRRFAMKRCPDVYDCGAAQCSVSHPHLKVGSARLRAVIGRRALFRIRRTASAVHSPIGPVLTMFPPRRPSHRQPRRQPSLVAPRPRHGRSSTHAPLGNARLMYRHLCGRFCQRRSACAGGEEGGSDRRCLAR